MQTIPTNRDPGIFEVDTLKNGIKVFHKHSNQIFGLPKVASSVLVQVGGRDDPIGKEGTAHFFEHMPFRGTKLFPSLYDLSHTIESNGGYINAFTTDEATGYEVTLPSPLLSDGIKRLSDMLLHPLMRPEDIEIERKVIQEELRNKLANVNFFARQELYKRLLGNHPIVHAVVGTEAALQSIGKDDLTSFHQEYYNSSNIILVFAGEYNKEELLSLCEQHFGDIASGQSTDRQAPLARTLEESNIVVLTPTQYNRSVYVLGRTLPKATLQESIFIHLFIDMLIRGMNSPLQEEIREKRGLAYNLGLHHNMYHDVGTLMFVVSTQFHQMDEVHTLAWQEMSKILDNKKRFDEVHHMFKQQLLYRDFGVGSLVDNAIDVYLDYGRLVSLGEYIDLLDKTTLEQVQDYMRPLLSQKEFLNIRVNCDK